MEPKNQYCQPSNADAEYRRYVQALAPAAGMGLGQAFALPAESFHVGKLRSLARALYGVLAVIDHGAAGLEVTFLPEGTPMDVFYEIADISVTAKNAVKVKPKKEIIEKDLNSEIAIEILKNCIANYAFCENEKLLKYDKKSEELRSKKRISRAYLQRTIQPLAKIKTKQNFNFVLKIAIVQGILREYGKSVFDILI